MFGLSASTDTSVESDERDASFVLDNVFKVLLRLSEVHAFKHLGGFSGVLEVSSNILRPRFATFGRVARFAHVSSHYELVVKIFLQVFLVFFYFQSQLFLNIHKDLFCWGVKW